MEFGKRHDTTDFFPCHLVTDLLRTNCCRLAMDLSFMLRTCYGLVVYVTDLLVTQWGSRKLVAVLLRGNWCNGF